MRRRSDRGDDAVKRFGGRVIGAALVTALIGLAVAGCTTGDPASAPPDSGWSPTPSATGGDAVASSTADADAPPLGGTVPESTPGVPVYTADQLRRTITDSGFGCATFTAATLDQGVGGRCEESMISVFVFPDQTSLESSVQRSTTSAAPKPFLVGNRWVMTVDHPDGSGDELVSMQDVIGGALVGPDL